MRVGRAVSHSPERGGCDLPEESGNPFSGHPSFLLGMMAVSSALRFLMFPPVSLAECAYVFLVPLLLVDWSGKRKRIIFLSGWVSGFLFWASTLIWLRHVTLPGTMGLAAILALFTGLWLLYYGRILRPLEDRKSRSALWMVPLAGAAGWVLLEWVRSWIFWGFPWNPVSVSQWNRPAVLYWVPVTGGWGLSFLLVWINLALARWLRRPCERWRGRGYLTAARKVPLALVVPLAVLLVGAGWYFSQISRERPSSAVRVGFVQPYSTMKWDREAVDRNLRKLWEETRSLAETDPQVLLWPESATPIPVIGEVSIRNGVEALSREMDAPILMGNMAFYPEKGLYDNAIFLVQPDGGLMAEYYIKRELVPFGEFIPFRAQLPFLEKIVPIGLDCRRGTEVVLFPFPSSGEDPRGDRIGPLICYEDVFPGLARDTVRAGADWLFVATNNVWYGEEAGAYQHAAHAVLRAVETRRPVLRSGNAGWSGWIDEWGHVRRRVVDPRGTIYFQGAVSVDVHRDLRFAGVTTPFVRYGDWLIGPCALLVILSFLKRRRP